MNHTSLITNEGLSVRISADKDIIDRIVSESPKSVMRWSLNGMHLKTDKNRITIENNQLGIESVRKRYKYDFNTKIYYHFKIN